MHCIYSHVYTKKKNDHVNSVRMYQKMKETKLILDYYPTKGEAIYRGDY